MVIPLPLSRRGKVTGSPCLHTERGIEGLFQAGLDARQRALLTVTDGYIRYTITDVTAETTASPVVPG